LLKNSSLALVLKGRGFKPRRKCHKINPASAAEVATSDCNATFSTNCSAAGVAFLFPDAVFPQLAKGGLKAVVLCQTEARHG